MGARIVVGRSYSMGMRHDDTGPWVATSDSVSVKLDHAWGPVQVIDWLKMHFPEALLIRVVEDDDTTYNWRFTGFANKLIPTFLDAAAKAAYGRSWTESHAHGVCILCGVEDVYEGICNDCKEMLSA